MNSQLAEYVLGRLSQEERDQIAERLFTDPEAVNELEGVEADLIDDYARGRLGKADAEIVRLHLLAGTSGKHQERLAVALGKRTRTRTKLWVVPWAAAAAAVLLLWFYGTAAYRVPIASVVLDLAATRGNAHVQQVNIDGQRDTRFSLGPDSSVPADSQVLVHTPQGRDLSFRYDAFVIRAKDLTVGRYQVEISQHSSLVAAGEFDVSLAR